MMKYLAAYAAALLAVLVLDAVWLGFVASGFYARSIGHLMAASPNLAAALLFYVLYPWGLVYFAVAPNRGQIGWQSTAAVGAAFGFFAYGTYDLSNLATLRDWPVTVAVVDVVWGCCVSAAGATAGKLALARVAGS
jgi:uncharacterized membrane protein